MKMKARPSVSVPNKHSPLLVGFLAVVVLIVAGLFVYVGAFVLQRMPRRTDELIPVSAHISPVSTSTLATLDSAPTITDPRSNGTDTAANNPDNTASISTMQTVSDNTTPQQETAAHGTKSAPGKPQPKPTKKRPTKQSFIEAVQTRLGLKRKQPNSQT